MPTKLDRKCSKTLAGALGAALGIGNGAAQAASYVTSCADDGAPGTLRSVLASGASDVDLYSQSQCSTITLTQGEIAVAGDIHLLGQGGAPHVIASANSRLLSHRAESPYGNTLTLEGLTLSGGRVDLIGQGLARGGCVSSNSSVVLANSVVSDCIAAAAGASAIGGAIAARGVTLHDSRVEDSKVYAAGDGARALGGGIYAFASFDCADSTITGNRAEGSPRGTGGGSVVRGSFTLSGCTIDHNSAGYAGGLYQNAYQGFANFIIDSTISANAASVQDGALYTNSPLAVYNSTIAFNTAPVCGGVHNVANRFSTAQVTLHSTIIANNTRASAPGCGDLSAALPIIGANNLVTAPGTLLPIDTIIADPRLTPLAAHGGATFTHGLSLSSPALDRGANPDALATDQRGLARIAGTAPDIGAFERQPDDDALFFGDFE